MLHVEVYDKAKWHLENESIRSKEEKLKHLAMIVNWLAEHGLLNNYGVEIFELGIDEEFSLTSKMLTNQGNELLGRYYKDWLAGVEYGKTPSLDIFEKSL